MSSITGNARKSSDPPFFFVNSAAWSSPVAKPTTPEMTRRVRPIEPPSPQAIDLSVMLPSGTYVIQIPKDEIYRVPSPDTTARFEEYTRRAERRQPRTCACCLACSAAALLLLVLILAAAGGTFYLICRPELPRYTIDRLTVVFLNLNTVQPLEAQFNVSVKAENPNKCIGFRYRNGGTVSLSHAGVKIANGTWPAFYHGKRNTTVVLAVLRGSGVKVSTDTPRAIDDQQRGGGVPLTMDVMVPVRVRLGSITSWTMNVRVSCEMTVDRLTADSRIVSNSCKTTTRN